MSNVAPVRHRPATSVRSLLGHALALLVACLLVLPWFGRVRERAGDDVRALPAWLGRLLDLDAAQITTGWGFTHQTVFGTLALVILLTHGIRIGAEAGAGAGAWSGRRVTTRIASVLGRLALLVAWLVAVVATMNGPFSLRLRPVGLLAEGASLGLLVAVHALLAAAAAAFSARPRTGCVVGGLVAVAGWLAYAGGGRSAGTVSDLSPFAWAFADSPIVNGPEPAGVAWLAAGCTVAALLTWVGSRRRPEA